MSNQRLNVDVNVRTGKSKRSFNQLVKQINNVQNKVRQAGDQAGYFSKKIVQATDKVNKLAAGNKQVASTAKKATKEYSAMERAIGKIGSKLKWLASVYFGVMGMGALINTSDTITSAQNRLNNLKGGSPTQTAKVMDKVFAASQRARTGYTDMLANVSKTMTLAGKAFDDNIDNAILFQEIMAKTYAMGGASAAEQSSSMYQMVQALGSGILQGDELRSVREGAPVAYKAIEEFAQGVYNTNESLKDLASQGKITSDIVVAAVLGMENEVNKSFAQMKMTFAQAWITIKNSAIKSFEPVFTMMSKALNSDLGKSVINGICMAIQLVANALVGVFNLVSSIYNFIVNNWNVIKYIVMAIGSALAIYIIYNLVMIINQLRLLIFGLFASLGTVIAETFAVAARCGWQAALALLGINWAVLVVVAVLVALIAIVWLVADNFRDACGIIVGSVFWVGSIIQNVIAFIVNLTMGLLNVMNAVCANIAIYYYNAFAEAKAAFWEWVQECLNGTGLIAKAVSKIAELFGLDAVSIDTKINSARGKIKDYVDIGDAWNEGWSGMPFSNPSDWYNKGYNIGTGAYDWIGSKMSLPNLDGSAYGLNTTDPSTMLGDIPANLKDTAGNTGKMADAMDLAEEDLEYLRKIADMEWRKEFTTAEIKVDMSNYNTVNGDSDLDGIVTRLADKLYEELDMVANGVYA